MNHNSFQPFIILSVILLILEVYQVLLDLDKGPKIITKDNIWSFKCHWLTELIYLSFKNTISV